MAIYHQHVQIFSRSQGVSILARAAYRAATKLRSDSLNESYDYSHKGGVIWSEILLPSNAPSAYKDRATLWNAVEQHESSADAQLAREVEVAIPREIPVDQRADFVRQYAQDNFVSAGMCADICIHDPAGKNNPHAHILLTLRPLNPDGTWAQQKAAKRGYALDSNGNKIPMLDEHGVQKKDKKGRLQWKREAQKKLNNWDTKEALERWRKAWETHCNAVLAPDNQISCRSLADQGIDRLPTRHEGVERIIRAKHPDARLDRNIVLYNAQVRHYNATSARARYIASLTEPDSYTRSYATYDRRYRQGYQRLYERLQLTRHDGSRESQQEISANTVELQQVQHEPMARKQTNTAMPVPEQSSRDVQQHSPQRDNTGRVQQSTNNVQSTSAVSSNRTVRRQEETENYVIRRGLSRTEYAEHVKAQRQAVAKSETIPETGSEPAQDTAPTKEPAKLVLIDGHIEMGTLDHSVKLSPGDTITGTLSNGDQVAITLCDEDGDLYWQDVDGDYDLKPMIDYLNDELAHGATLIVQARQLRHGKSVKHNL